MKLLGILLLSIVMNFGAIALTGGTLHLMMEQKSEWPILAIFAAIGVTTAVITNHFLLKTDKDNSDG